jgi:antitoxin component YwqK of YwqJK toxin-antitoxin module
VGGKLQWSQIKDHRCITTVSYTYLNENVYASEICEYHDGELSYVCYKNDLHHGMLRYCDTEGSWSWVSFAHGLQHGLAVNWFPNGTRQYMGKMKNDQPSGTHYRWLINGTLEHKTEFTIHNRAHLISK